MAVQYVVSTGKVTLTAASTKSLVLLAPNANTATVIQVDISLDASALVAGVQFDLYRVSTLGSPAGTTGTVNNIDPARGAATTTALTVLTTEPTAVTVLASYYLQPVGGLYTLQFPLGREPDIQNAGARWGVRYVTPTGVAPDCLMNVWFEE